MQQLSAAGPTSVDQMGTARHRTPLLDLPTELLENIAVLLPQSDRIRFTSCGSRQLLALSRSSGQLWSDLHTPDVQSPEQLHSLAAFLRRRAAVLAQACITLNNESLEMWRELHVLLGGLSGSPLRMLQLQLPLYLEDSPDPLNLKRCLCLGSWLSFLPRLLTLAVEADRILVHPSFARLTGLLSLDLDWTGGEPCLELPPACLPSSLRRLNLEGVGNLDLQAAGQLPLLQELILSRIYTTAGGLPAGVLRFLCTGTRLTKLKLREFSAPPEGGLSFLEPLTNLRVLAVKVYKHDGCEVQQVHMDLLPLAELTLLSRLELGGTAVEAVPASLLALPQLKVFTLSSWCIPVAPVPLAPAGSRLEQLSLDLPLVVNSRAQLSALVSLRSLCVRWEDFNPASPDEPSGFLAPSADQTAALVEMLCCLGRLPRLEELEVRCVLDGSPPCRDQFFSSADAAAALALLRDQHVAVGFTRKYK